MQIENASQIETANQRFNHFHDGFLRRIALSRDIELFADPSVNSPEEVQEFWNGTTVELDIRHSNYDWSNQPNSRLIKIRALACIGLLANIERFLGKHIFDLRFETHEKGVECILTHHADGEIIRMMENGTQTSLFVAESIQIEEATLR